MNNTKLRTINLTYEQEAFERLKKAKATHPEIMKWEDFVFKMIIEGCKK